MLGPKDPWSRRRFLAVTGCSLGAAAVGCGGSGVDVLTHDVDVALADHPGLSTLGRTVFVDVGIMLPLAVTQVSDGEFVVTNTECPHAHCEVERSGAGLLCPCHGSRFDLDGTRRAGPANDDLVLYDWGFDGSVLTIHGA